MKYRIVATDLDKTLLNEMHQVPKRNKEAIRRAGEKGILLVPCTGRGPGFLGNLWEDLELKRPGCYSILCNGACVVENATGRLLTLHALEFETAKELLRLGTSRGYAVQIFTPERVYTYNPRPKDRMIAALFGTDAVFRKGDQMEDLKDEPVLKLLFLRDHIQDEADLGPLVEEVSGKKACYTYSNNDLMEINRAGVNKGTGLRDLAEILGIPMEETIGIGDNFNDMELIKAAGLGIAVSNAVPELKAVAGAVTEADNSQGAVGEAICRFCGI